MIHITTSAQKHLFNLLTNQETDSQIRVFVINPNTYNIDYGIAYCPLSTVKFSDIELKFDKISVYIDELSAPYLQDIEIDLIIDEIGTHLTLKAPNIKRKKTSSQMSLIERVENILLSKINPQLSGHGGKVTLIDISEDMLVILKFGGSCNGCAMINYTLKEKIEKELLKNFPELKGIQDVTKHQFGKHSYY